jgi:hypothetical protein
MTQLTHYIKFIVLISSIGFFSSCNNASLQKADGEPKGGCYHMVNEKLNEAVNVSYDDKSLSGSGLRTNLAFNENFELNISGKSMGNGQYDVTIQAKSLMQGRENTIETHYETWKFEQKKLSVINRNSALFSGNLDFYQVNCDASASKDSTLYDGFFGFQEGYAAVTRKGLWGIIDEKWNLVIPCQYKELGNVSEGTVKFYDEKTQKWGMLEVPGGQVLIPSEFIQMTAFSEGYAAALDDKTAKWCIFNRKGVMVMPPTFWTVSYYAPNPYLKFFNEGMANVALADAKWGYIDTQLKTVIPCTYLFAEPFRGGMARVNKNGPKWSYIDKTGKCVKDCD